MSITKICPGIYGGTFILFAISCMTGCGGGSSSGELSHAASSSSRSALQEYTDCTSTAPVNIHNPAQPVITLNGDRVVNLPLNSAYIDAGATAVDPADGDISSKLQALGLDTVNTAVAGDYLIRYRVSNRASIAATEVVHIVRVNSGTFVPISIRYVGSTSAHVGYYEHLPVNYSDDPAQKFPLLIAQHGFYHARFLDPYTVQAPLNILEDNAMVHLMRQGLWDDSLPFIVLAFQKCIDDTIPTITAQRTKLFIDYAINTYQVDTSRIYMTGHSQGAGDTWDYALNYPDQLAAIVPVSGYYGTQSGCVLKSTPAWAFNGEQDDVVDFHNVVQTVDSINACQPQERAKVTVLKGFSHDDIQNPIFSLSGLGTGLSAYDIYDQSIYEWMLQHHAF